MSYADVMTNRSTTATAAVSARPESRSRASWPWIVVAVIIGLGKTEGFRVLEHHLWGWVIVLAVMSGWSLLRAKPVATAVLAAPAIALLLEPHLIGVAVIVGFAAFAALITLFVAIGTLLRHVDDRS